MKILLTLGVTRLEQTPILDDKFSDSRLKEIAVTTTLILFNPAFIASIATRVS